MQKIYGRVIDSSIRAWVADIVVNSVPGAQGTQGTIGAQGTEGAQGSAGYVGSDGAQGTQGTEGAQGAIGSGTQGTQGTIGSGTQGTEGAQGAIGSGTQGTQGTEGIGTQGTEGAQGAIGSGTQGTQGTIGSGTQGTEGAQGAQGVQGTEGAIPVDYIKEASLGTDFYWNAGSLEVSIFDSTDIFYSKVQVDASFALITHNHDNVYVKEASIGDGLYWVDGELDVSVASGTGDVTKAYVDGSLSDIVLRSTVFDPCVYARRYTVDDTGDNFYLYEKVINDRPSIQPDGITPSIVTTNVIDLSTAYYSVKSDTLYYVDGGGGGYRLGQDSAELVLSNGIFSSISVTKDLTGNVFALYPTYSTATKRIDYTTDVCIYTDLTSDSLINVEYFQAYGSVPVNGVLSYKSSSDNYNPTYGDEIVTNVWDTSDGWTSDDYITWTHSTGNTNPLSDSTVVPEVGKSYYVTYTVSGGTTGTCSATFGGSSARSASTLGNKTSYIVATTTDPITFTPGTTYNRSITNVSIREASADVKPTFAIYDETDASKFELRTISDANSIFLGLNAGKSTLSGANNIGIGTNALTANKTGTNNVGIGYESLKANVTGTYNVGLGRDSLLSDVSGGYNTAIGAMALRTLKSGNYNTAVGNDALYSLTYIDSYNVALGFRAGRFAGSGTTACASLNYSTLIGPDVRPLAVGDTNEIVIGGYQLVGNGSNTVTIGNAACTSTYLMGNVVLSQTTDDPSSAINKYYVDETFEPKITGVTADVVIDGSTYSFTNGILTAIV